MSKKLILICATAAMMLTGVHQAAIANDIVVIDRAEFAKLAEPDFWAGDLYPTQTKVILPPDHRFAIVKYKPWLDKPPRPSIKSVVNGHTVRNLPKLRTRDFWDLLGPVKGGERFLIEPLSVGGFN